MMAKAKHDPPLKIPMQFDEAMKRAMQVKPPEGGWKKYEKKLKRERRRRRSKTAA